MIKAVLFTALITVTACSKKKDDAPAPSDKPTTGAPAEPSAAAPAAPAAPAAAAGKLDCDKIMPNDLRDKYFAKMEFKNEPGALPEIGKCAIDPGASGVKYGGSVMVICNEAQKSNRDQIIEAMMKASKDMKPIDGVPQSLMNEVPIGTQVTAYDQDSNCKVDITAPKGVDAVAFTKDLLAALPPK